MSLLFVQGSHTAYHNGQQVLLDDDSESESSDSGLEFVDVPKEAGTDRPKAGDSDFLEASLRQQQALPRKASQRDAETEAVLMRNRAALARVKAIMDDPLPEQADYGEHTSADCQQRNIQQSGMTTLLIV